MVLLYSWENSLEKRELIWTCGGKKDVKNDLSQVTIVSRDMRFPTMWHTQMSLSAASFKVWKFQVIFDQ